MTKRDIFKPRKSFKPFTYPEIEEFKHSIQHSYWLVTEFNFTADIQDYHTKLTEQQRSALKNALLAISQIEIAVKKFWSRLGDRFPSAEFDQVGISFGECHVDGTEVLTPTGWKNFEDIRVGDDVIQFNQNNTFNITKVLKTINQDYIGQIVKFSKNSTEVQVTPNHRMLVYYNNSLREYSAEELEVTNSSLFLPEAGNIVGGELTELSFVDRLCVALQADGSRRYYNSGYGRQPRRGNGKGSEYEIRIQKSRKIERLDWILSNINSDSIAWSKKPIPSRNGMFCYTIRINDDFDYKTFDWVNIYNKSTTWCEDFIQELSLWDGTRLPNKKDCKVKFSSINKKVIDRAQLIGIGAGYRTNIITHIDNRKASYKPMYILSFTSNRNRTTLPPLKKEYIDYTGIVRCISVESGAIITRFNNKTFIAGNSEVRHADAYSHLLKVLGLNEDFEILLEKPVIKGRVEYLTKYLKTSSEKSNEEFALTLTLFAMFVENVSLFSQFAIIKSFNKHLNMFKGIDNVVQATQQEEQIHALFGAKVLSLIKEEHPEWFTEEFYAIITKACKKAYVAECAIIDWIFEQGELDFLPINSLKEFIKDRFNQSLQMIGGQNLFEVDSAVLEPVKWFTEELKAEVNPDFFYKKSTAYSKRAKSIAAEELF